MRKSVYFVRVSSDVISSVYTFEIDLHLCQVHCTSKNYRYRHWPHYLEEKEEDECRTMK